MAVKKSVGKTKLYLAMIAPAPRYFCLVKARRALICLALILFLHPFGQAVAQDNPIAVRMSAFQAAYNAGDAAAIANFYTEKAALIPQAGRALIGRDQISNHYAQAFAAGVTDLQYRILEIDAVSASVAIEIGETQVDLKGQKISGRYMHIWKNRDGIWLLHRDMYQVLGSQ